MCVVHYQCRFVGSLISLTAVCLTGGGGDGHRHHFIQTRSTKIFFFDGFTEHLVSDELGLRSFDTGKKRQFLPLGIYLTVIPVGRNVRWLLV